MLGDPKSKQARSQGALEEQKGSRMESKTFANVAWVPGFIFAIVMKSTVDGSSAFDVVASP